MRMLFMRMRHASAMRLRWRVRRPSPTVLVSQPLPLPQPNRPSYQSVRAQKSSDANGPEQRAAMRPAGGRCDRPAAGACGAEAQRTEPRMKGTRGASEDATCPLITSYCDWPGWERLHAA